MRSYYLRQNTQSYEVLIHALDDSYNRKMQLLISGRVAVCRTSRTRTDLNLRGLPVKLKLTARHRLNGGSIGSSRHEP